jgi:hypothetical protein
VTSLSSPVRDARPVLGTALDDGVFMTVVSGGILGAALAVCPALVRIPDPIVDGCGGMYGGIMEGLSEISGNKR